MKTTHNPRQGGLWAYVCLMGLLCFTTVALSQTPIVTIRFANPHYDCLNAQYCVDVEYLSNTPGVQVFGTNVRFIYPAAILGLVGFSDFQGGYGPVFPDPPVVTNSPFAGPALFNFAGSADIVNGAIQLTNPLAPPILLSDVTWTKLYQVCFVINDPNANINSFCPSIVWDMEQDPANGGFGQGDDGVVITLVDPTMMIESIPADENVVQFNWMYSGPGTPPYGSPIEVVCTSLDCFPSIVCAVDTTIECDESTAPAITGFATATDICAGDPTITYNDMIAAGNCPNNITITRTWTATNACALSDICVQLITVIDTTDPSIICPIDITVQCAGQVPVPNPGSVGASDNCTGAVTVTFAGDIISNQTCANRYKVTRTYRATDGCGNSATCSQTITVLDNTAPSITCPIDITAQCAALVPVPNPGSVSTSDNCGGAASVIFVGEVTSNQNCPNCHTLTRTYRATDACGNSATCNQTITVFEIAVPVIIGDKYICTGDETTYSIANFNPLLTYNWFLQSGGMIINNTGATVTIKWQSQPGGPFILSVTAIGGPGCNATGTFGVFTQDAEGLACFDQINLCIDNECGTVVLSGMILTGDQAGDNNYEVIIMDLNGHIIPGNTFTWLDVGKTFKVAVVSKCSGQTCWGYVTVRDNLPPQIKCVCPAEGVSISSFTGTLNAQSPVFTRPNAMAQGGACSIGAEGVPYQSFPFYLNMAGGNQFDVVTFTAPSGDSFLALYQDSFDPSQPCKNLVAADDDSGPGFLSQITAALEADRTYIMVMTTFNNSGNDYGDFEIGITSNANAFLVNPACQITCSQIEQIAAGNIPEELRPEVIEDCGGSTLEIINIDIDYGSCSGRGFIHVTWKATDHSGNTSTCLQKIDIVPLTLETLKFPANFEGTCNGSSDPSVTGWPTVDGMELNLPAGLCNLYVTYKDLTIRLCGVGTKVIRTWTVIDLCSGQKSVNSQDIHLADHEGPVLTCVENLEVGTDPEYCYANVFLPKPIAIDACSKVVSYKLFSADGTVVSFGNNFVVNGLKLGTHHVKWVVTDECDNSSSCNIQITVVDDVPPVVSCHHHTVVSLTDERPHGVTLVPAQVFNDGSIDNCGIVSFRARRMDSCIDFDWTTKGACVDEVPGGIPPVNSKDRGTDRGPCVPFTCCDVGGEPIMVELEVTDAAGNVNYCMVEVEVQDKLSPSLVSPPTIIVSCELLFNIQEGTFKDSEGNNDGSLDEDPLSALFGNMYDAFRHQQSERKNVTILDPDNMQYPQPYNWGKDGIATDNCEADLQVTVSVINDCTGSSFQLPPIGAVKLIERRFQASDGNNVGYSLQKIWVVDYHPFYIKDKTCDDPYPNDGVIWPCDELLTSCSQSLDGLGEPIIFEDACSLVGMNHADNRYEIAENACFKVLREWTVIDWCQYNPNTGHGIWSYVQTIKVIDAVAPEFLDCPQGPVELCVNDPGIRLPANNQVFLGVNNQNSTSCSVQVTMSHRIHESCSESVLYDVKVYPFNGTAFIQMVPTTTVALDQNHEADISFDTEQSTIPSVQQNGLPYNSPLCGEYHRVLWSVEDGCGNRSYCDYLFRLEDCKSPTPVCIHGLSTVEMGPNGEVTIFASSFNESSYDDCTPANQLLFSFSGTSYEPNFTYTCANVPAFDVELTEQIWVADGGTDQNCNGQIEWSERNKDFCTTTIMITDDHGYCDQLSGMLSGEILTDHQDAVEKVIVNLSSPQQLFPPYTTSGDGKFVFGTLPMGLDYMITPERNDDYKNGVSTLDLIRIQKHLLGKEIFTSPYQYIAADANNSHTITALDLLDLRKLILGLSPVLPNNESWRFIDKNYVMPDPANPWLFNENLFINSWHGQNISNDFIAVKIGDVNNSVKANAFQLQPREERRVMNIKVESKAEAKAGEIIEWKLTFPEVISGFQWTMETDGLEYLGVISGDIQIDDSNVGLPEKGIVTMSWNGDVLSYNDGKQEMSIILRWRVTTPGKVWNRIRLTSLVTPAESYTPSGEILQVRLVPSDTEVSKDFTLYQNKPNPWNGQTTIGFDLPEDNHAELTIFDITGVRITTIRGEFKEGYNTIVLTAKDVPSTGVMYYRLESGGYSASKKMVLIR